MAIGHDRGGQPDPGPIPRSGHDLADWERLADGLNIALASKGYYTVDEQRHAMERLGPEKYESLDYYERWAAALEMLVTEKGLLSQDEIERRTIVATLERFDGHRAKTARALGIGIRTLSGKLRAYGYAPREKDFVSTG